MPGSRSRQACFAATLPVTRRPRVPAAPGGEPSPSTRGLALGGLVGAQVRLGIGGLFTELGYRGAVYQQTAVDSPAGNTWFLLLGYRVSTN